MILALILRHRIPIALAAALLGLFAASWHYRSAYHAERALRQADRAAYGQAQAEATLIAKRALDAVEARYRSKANEADRSHTDALVDARSATDAYLGRMRTKAASCTAGGAVASAQGGSASVPANVPAELVMAEADVRAAAEWQAFGSACRNWAMTLEVSQTASGLAESALRDRER
jgi:hypothetical protein